MCYGWFFKIPIIFTTLKFCIPGLAIPMPSIILVIHQVEIVMVQMYVNKIFLFLKNFI